MPTLESVLSRVGDRKMDLFIRPDILSLISALNEGNMNTSSRVEMIISLHTKVGILANKSMRNALLSSLTTDQAKDLATYLGLSFSNPFDALKDLRMTRERRQGLYYWFQILDHEIPGEDEVVEKETIELVSPQHGLFPHQNKAILDMESYLASYQNRAFLHMPTGSGKTRTAMNYVCRLMNKKPNGLYLWLAFNGELCEQAASEFTKAWGFHGSSDAKLVRMWGDHDIHSLPENGIVFAGLDKLWSRIRRDQTFLARIAHHFELIVFDEAHQSLANTYQLMVDMLLNLNQKCRLLGLSATPGRTWNDPEADEKLSEMYYRQKVTLEVEGHESPIDYLVEEEYLSKPLFHQLTNESTPIGPRERLQVAEMLEYNASVYKKLEEDEMRNLLILRKLEDLIKQGHKRILVFAISVEHSDILSSVFKQRGHICASITSKSGGAQREIWLRRFVEDHDDTCILFNYGVLTTGFDAPLTSAALIARPTKSLVLYSQMVGRVIRGSKVGGTPSAEIYTVVDKELPGFGNLAEAFTNWEDVW